MQTLAYGSVGALVQLLQLALVRSGERLAKDGIFGSATLAAVRSFQRRSGLAADGIAGPLTHRALLPYYTGFVTHRVRRGESLWLIANRYSAAPDAVIAANPGVNALNLAVGAEVTVPLPFPVVPGDVDCSSELVSFCVRGIAARYPCAVPGAIGKSVMGRPLHRLSLGAGERRLIYAGAHHANEWITALLLLRFAEEYARAVTIGSDIRGRDARELYSRTQLVIIPAVDPDGIDLVTGAIEPGAYLSSAMSIAADYPLYPFPSGWKANIRGVDLNLQYPAGWEQARENKLALGISSPAPADFVGTRPLTAPEARALYDFTLAFDPALILAYHTQGEVIYWRYADRDPPGARQLAEALASASGYALEDTPFASAFAGYKDWFIDAFDRPGFTVEAGRGTNPLPVSALEGMYARNLGILVTAMEKRTESV